MSAAPRAIPRALAKALAPTGATCYRHCSEPVRPHRLAGALPGLAQVFACPSGVVSVTSYVEWSRRDPSAAFQRYLTRHAVPSSRVRRHDLRLATRHGPELGRIAERRLRRPGTPPLRVVYWRVYPFRDGTGIEHRLFVCRRRGHPGPVFYTAPSTEGDRLCPVCVARRRTVGQARKSR